MNRTVSKCLLPTDKRAVDVSCEQSHRITGVFQDEMSVRYKRKVSHP